MLTTIILKLRAFVNYLAKVQRMRLGKKYTATTDTQRYLVDKQAEGLERIHAECDRAVELAHKRSARQQKVLAGRTSYKVQALEAERVKYYRQQQELV